jgi:hypothetical protein
MTCEGAHGLSGPNDEVAEMVFVTYTCVDDRGGETPSSVEETLPFASSVCKGKVRPRRLDYGE